MIAKFEDDERIIYAQINTSSEIESIWNNLKKTSENILLTYISLGENASIEIKKYLDTNIDFKAEYSIPIRWGMLAARVADSCNNRNTKPDFLPDNVGLLIQQPISDIKEQLSAISDHVYELLAVPIEKEYFYRDEVNEKTQPFYSNQQKCGKKNRKNRRW